ncbi:sulfotransferase domain-containing protein [bacterium]|nr:sulfotransferase domain-containing protein [bacterium]
MRYERMREETLGEMRHLAHVLDLPYDIDQLAVAVERRAYENIPADRKGPGKFVRNTQVGGWRNDLEQQEIKRIENGLGDFLTEHGYAFVDGEGGS